MSLESKTEKPLNLSRRRAVYRGAVYGGITGAASLLTDPSTGFLIGGTVAAVNELGDDAGRAIVREGKRRIQQIRDRRTPRS